MLGIEPPDDGEIVNEEVIIIIIERAMDKQQAIRIINQLLDEYQRNEDNWEITPEQEIYWEGLNYTIEGTATWSECSACYDVGDEQIPYEYFEPELRKLDCHLMLFDDDGEPIKDILIDENEL